MPRTSLSLSESKLAFGLYLVLAVVFTAPLSFHPGSLAANDGDPLHISWILAWDAHQIVRDPLHLFDSNTFYPYESSLAFSEHMIVPALMAAPVFYVTGNALLAQNLTVVLTLALSAWAMFLLVREVLGRTDAALVAGLVFVFHTYDIHEVPRLQLLSIQWWPLAFLFMHRFFVRRERRDAFLFALFFLLQGLSCTYYLFYATLVLGLWIAVYALTSEGGIARLRHLVFPFALVLGVLLVFSTPYRRMLRDFDYQRELVEGLDLVEYLRPPEGSLWSGLIGLDVEPSTVPQFLGFVPLLLAGVGLLRAGRDRFLWLSAATAALGALLSLGPTLRAGGRALGPGLYGLLYEHLPFFQVLRNPERMSLLVHFGLAVLAGYGASVLIARAPGRRALLLRGLILVVLPFEHLTGPQPYAAVPTGESAPEVYHWLRAHGDGTPVVELPLYPREQLRRHALYMFYSTIHWQPIVFGRTSFYPPATSYLAWEVRDFPEPDSLALLARVGVGRIVVRPRLWDAHERGEKLTRIGTLSALVPEGRFPAGGFAESNRYGFGEERLYRLAGAAVDDSPLCVPSDEIDPADWKLRGEGSTPVEWAVDRDRSTKFKSTRQLPGIKLEVDLGRTETIGAVVVELGYPYDQFPRDLGLKASGTERGGFDRVAFRHDLATKLELLDALLERPSEAAIKLRFEPIEARRLRFWVREGMPWDFALPEWSLPELRIYRACTPAVDANGSR